MRGRNNSREVETIRDQTIVLPFTTWIILGKLLNRSMLVSYL